jgi:DNA-binding transcriptional LysR family regulator
VVPYMVTSETTVVRLLERIPLVVVATPQYLQTSSKPRNPVELANHHFVLVSPSIRRLNIDFRNGDKVLSVPRRFDISSNSPAFNLEMVLESFGIGVLPEDLVHEELASGKLVRLLSDFQLMDDSVEIWLAYSNRTLLPAKVRAFVDYAAAFFAEPTTSR